MLVPFASSFCTGLVATLALTLVGPLPPVTAAPGEAPGDKFVLAGGAGNKDGSSWGHALDGSAGLQAGWDALGPGNTLWVGSGAYPNAQLSIKSGGEAGKLKRLAGKDTGGGAPVFQGTFQKDNPGKTGANFISVSNGADYWAVQDIHVRDYKIGIASGAGGHQGVRINNFDVTGSREGISLMGGGTAENPERGSHDIEISDCEFVGYTKRGIRLKGGNYAIRITNCVADAGGAAWATEPFHMGFSVEGPGDRDITYTNCVALNNYHNAGENYWNADGFCAEKVDNLRYINCKAFDNTDGGWDAKASYVTLEGCIAVGNKRNYRFWGPSTKLINCLAADSVYPGGTGGDLGLWTKGSVIAENSTFFNSTLASDGSITLVNSILARGKNKPFRVAQGERAGIKLVDTVIWEEKTGDGQDPGLVAPPVLWDGQGNAYTSLKFGKSKGYSGAPSAVLPFRRTLPLPPGDRSRAVDAGTDENDPPLTAEQVAQLANRQAVLPNAGFEAGLENWAGGASEVLQIKSGGAGEGTQYLTLTAGAKRVDLRVKITSLVEGENYTLTFLSRGNTSQGARVILRKNAKASYLASTAPAAGAEWTPRTLKFVAPAREVLMEISVRSAGTMDLDGFSITREK